MVIAALGQCRRLVRRRRDVAPPPPVSPSPSSAWQSWSADCCSAGYRRGGRSPPVSPGHRSSSRSSRGGRRNALCAASRVRARRAPAPGIDRRAGRRRAGRDRPPGVRRVPARRPRRAAEDVRARPALRARRQRRGRQVRHRPRPAHGRRRGRVVVPPAHQQRRRHGPLPDHGAPAAALAERDPRRRRCAHRAHADPRHNAAVGAATLRRYLDQMHEDLFLGLLAYNIGPANGGLRAIMEHYGARDFVTIQPYLAGAPARLSDPRALDRPRLPPVAPGRTCRRTRTATTPCASRPPASPASRLR